MKKLFSIITLAMLTITSINAQKFGAKAGLNLAKVSYSDNKNDEGAKIKTGFQIGVVAEFEISDKFSFQPELIYSMQGSKHELEIFFGTATVSSESTFKFDYINVPLMAKYYIIEGLSIQAGPQIGFLLSAKTNSTVITTGEIITTTESLEKDIKVDLKNIDFGLNIGVGYKMKSGLFFDARYNIGLIDLFDKRAENDNETLKNRVINFAIGYSFN